MVKNFLPKNKRPFRLGSSSALSWRLRYPFAKKMLLRADGYVLDAKRTWRFLTLVEFVSYLCIYWFLKGFFKRQDLVFIMYLLVLYTRFGHKGIQSPLTCLDQNFYSPQLVNCGLPCKYPETHSPKVVKASGSKIRHDPTKLTLRINFFIVKLIYVLTCFRHKQVQAQQVRNTGGFVVGVDEHPAM